MKDQGDSGDLNVGEEWVRIRLSDYEGWIEASKLAEPATASDWQATILPLRAAVYANLDDDTFISWIYATTVLPASLESAGRVPVQLPGGGSGWMDASAVELHRADAPPAELGPDAAISLAMKLLGVTYRWGGTTMEGIDCSGLTQLCCRAAGVRIPRDADQQYRDIPYVVERAGLRAGDLVYFASDGKITHTGLMLDPRRYIHARGSPANQVILTGLAPGDPNYDRSLAGRYAGGRRPFVRKVRLLV